MRIRRLGFFLPALLLAAAPLIALDAGDGRVRLTLYEGIGRFGLACQTNGSSGQYLPLLAAQDPRTTTLSIVVGNKIYRMGESSEFSEKSEKVPGGARFVWRSSFLQVTETFTFIAPADSPVSTGVRIDLSLKNLSEQDVTAGARYLFDTYLGETGGVHFRTSAVPKVSKELTVKAADKTTWWESPLPSDPDGFGLQVMMSGTGITTPDRVVFANWKRLSDSNWAYDTSGARDFSLLPYSINDSAAAQYYDPRPIARSGEATITIVLGLYSKSGYVALPAAPVAAPPVTTPAADFTAGVQQSLAAGQNAASDAQAARADLGAVNTILDELDARISGQGTVSVDELSLIESALKELGSRAGRFAPPAR
jgi:flagellin-like hook-associated protein FlgL